MNAKFQLEVSFNDATGEPVAAYLRIRVGTVAETREVKEGVAFADYDDRGILLGVELLGPCEIATFDDITRTEPPPVSRFLKGGIPRDLICA